MAEMMLEMPPTTAKEITAAVVRSLFPPRYWAVCPNVSWGMLPWEADILALSPSDVLHEIEVKVGLYDLRRDSLKSKWGRRPHGEPPWGGRASRNTVEHHVHRFWYAVTPEIEKEALALAEEFGCGVIVCRKSPQPPVPDHVSPRPKVGPWRVDAEKVLMPRRLQGPDEWKPEECRAMLHRLCSLRYWDAFKNGGENGSEAS